MKIEKSETDNVYVCYCILREMHPGKHQAERLREITEALWDAQTFYEKMGALMFCLWQQRGRCPSFYCL